MSPPNYNSVEEISKSEETKYEEGLERLPSRKNRPSHSAASRNGVSNGYFCKDTVLLDKFQELSLKPTVKLEEDVINNNTAQDPVEPLYFEVGGLKFDDLKDCAEVAEAISFEEQKTYFRRISAVKNTTKKKSKGGKLVRVNKKEIAIFRYGDTVFAIDEKCPHAGGPLHLGDIESIGLGGILCIVCPWHKWKIELTTGKLKVPDRQRDTLVYPVKISDDGCLSIGFKEFAPDYFSCNEEF
eukprot:gene18086-19893_t